MTDRLSPIRLADRPLRTIAIPDHAEELLAYAASELQKYLRRSLGQQLPVVRQTVPTDGCIWLQVAAVADVFADVSGYDRTRIIARDGYLELLGENPRSVLYAVYDFLKEFVGARFFAPGEAFEDIPAHDTLSLPATLDAGRGSAFAIRDYVNRTNSPDALSYAVKNRLNTILGCGPWVNGSENCSHENARLVHSYGLLMRGPGHSWKHFVPDAQACADHPEYAPLRNGRRIFNGRTACFSNPEVRRIFRDNLRQYLREHPYWDIFAFWAEDLPDYSYCDCPQCAGLSTTDLYLMLVNEAAQVVAEELPAARFEFIVYQGTNQPPVATQKLFRDGENMLVNFCFGQTRDLFHPFAQRTATNEGLFRLYRQWREWLQAVGYRGQTMIMEYYNLCEYPDSGPCGRSLLWPLAVIQEDVRYYRDEGLSGLGAFTGFDRLAFPSPWRHWAWMNLWADPELDLAALRREFHSRYFGAAADRVMAYDDRLEQLMHEPLSEDNIAAVEALGTQLDGLSGDRFETLRVHLQLCVLVKRLHWTFRQDDRPAFEALKERYLAFQQDHAELLARMAAPYPFLWFNFIFYRIGWLPDGSRRQWRPGTEATLQ